jgi:hypothetical protein
LAGCCLARLTRRDILIAKKIMLLNSCQLRLLLTILALLAPMAAPSEMQAQPSGGRLPPEAGPVTTTTKSTGTTARTSTSKRTVTPKTSASNATRNTASRSTRSSALPLGAIDGKWWTTGNGFGDSEVVFTQTGPRVSGVIKYADGRTGVVEGMIVGKRLQHRWTNSSGNGGSGWLELSWNNFLGGPWQNANERNGSWTLTRIEGKWCFGGSRSRVRTVTHDSRGRLTSIAEDGTPYEGRLEGPRIFLDSDLTSIEGTMNFRQNRVEWSSGFSWTWCGR